MAGWWSGGGISTILLPSSFASRPTLDIIVLGIHSTNASWFGACDALVRMCGCELFGALAHYYTCRCHHVLCAQSDLLQNDHKQICHLRIASVAALRAGAETDAESPALDSAHGSQPLSAPALSTGSQRWLSAHGLSMWLQRVSLSAGSHRVADLGKNVMHIYWNFIFPPIIIAFAIGHTINKNILQYTAIYCCFMLQP